MLLGSAALIPGAARADGNAQQRLAEAFQIHLDAAQLERHLPLPDHPTNGDEQRYYNRIGS